MVEINLKVTTRPDGTPLATELTDQIIQWACQGGCDPKRIIPLGIPEDVLIALWNVRVGKRECGFDKGNKK